MFAREECVTNNPMPKPKMENAKSGRIIFTSCMPNNKIATSANEKFTG